MTAIQTTNPQQPRDTTPARPNVQSVVAALRPNETRIAIFPGTTPDEAPMEAFVKKTPDGIVRSTLTLVRLRPKDVFPLKTWDPVAKKSGTQLVLAASAYNRMCQFSGIHWIEPDTVVGEDGRPHSNPYLHKVGKHVQYVRVRQVGIWRNPQGNLVADELTLVFNLDLYRIQDLMSRWTGRHNDTPKGWGKLVPAKREEDIPAQFGERPQRAFEIDEGTYLVVDLNNKEVIKLISEHINRARKADSIAISFCRRNIAKRFFAVSTVGEDMIVHVVGWPQVDRDLEQLHDTVVAAKDGRVHIDSEIVNMTHRSCDVSDHAEAQAGMDPGLDVLDATPDEIGAPGVDVPQDRKPFEPPLSPEVEVLREKFTKAIESGIDVDKLWSTLGSMGIDGDGKMWSVDDWQKAAETAETMLIQKVQKKAGMSSEAPAPVADPKPAAKTKTKPGEQAELIPGASKPDKNLAAGG